MDRITGTTVRASKLPRSPPSRAAVTGSGYLATQLRPKAGCSKRSANGRRSGYAQAWDVEACAPWRPISAGEARERDAAGLPYVVVYREPGREAPLEVRLVSRQDHHVGLWAYDAQGRRSHDLDMRLLDDPSRLLRRYSVSWHCTGPEMAEFDKACPRITVDLMQEHQRLHGDV